MQTFVDHIQLTTTSKKKLKCYCLEESEIKAMIFLNVSQHAFSEQLTEDKQQYMIILIENATKVSTAVTDQGAF